MDFEQIFGLGLFQGLTEFLPISSSAHLILMPLLFGWEDQGLAFDVAVHVGTLAAVLFYFRKDLKRMIDDSVLVLRGNEHSEHSRMLVLMFIGTIPIGLVGFVFSVWIENNLRSPVVISLATIVFGLLLWFADRQGKKSRHQQQITMRDAVIVGLYQVLALIPGTSRSGITMTGALLLGLDRQTAARFSFLLSIPLIALAGAFKMVSLTDSHVAPDWVALVLGTVVSALSAFLCITFFIKLVDQMGMLPFVVYRLVLGVALLYFFV